MEGIISLIVSLIILIIGIILLCKAHSIKLQRNKEQENYFYQLESNIKILEDDIAQLTNDTLKEREKFDEAYLKTKQECERAETAYNKRKEELNEQEKLYQQVLNNSSSNYLTALEKAYKEAEQQYDGYVAELKNEEQYLIRQLNEYQDQIKDLRQTFAAGVEAQLRERELEEQQDFYKVKLSPADMQDVMRLEALKPSLNNRDILSKLIWSTYFQKQTNELCNRILGTKEAVCGIYKITNLLTKQMYIGQSIDIATRWKTHMKCGLGIDASSTNKLYKAMQSDGIINFCFELLEECPKEQLNEKEKFWINIYQSEKYGYNSTKGVLK